MPTDELVAIHEAGHAVVAIALGQEFEYVTIEANGNFDGHVHHDNALDFEPGKSAHRQLIEPVLMMFQAGEIADTLAGTRLWESGIGDRAEALRIALVFTEDAEEAEAWLNWLRVRTRRLLAKPMWWSAVNALAVTLIAERTLTHEQCKYVVKNARNEFVTRKYIDPPTGKSDTHGLQPASTQQPVPVELRTAAVHAT